jgi:hypothetical protein
MIPAVQHLAPAYRGVISTDHWFSVDLEHRQIANNLFGVPS